ncbi:unnamed protein product [Cuscuta epithymum]|uniref:Growth-regulating factor n=1 Tax=Cuscuta epithymum TaxID=186058 RepID=A0AAV0CGP0_9ASTE|nr:unnamed protein product [Cuscuta epithymum]
MDFEGESDGGAVVACSDKNTATATANTLFSAPSSDAVSDVDTKQKWYTSIGFQDQERPFGANISAEDDLRPSKVAKAATTIPMLRCPFVGSESQQMLSFTPPYYYHPAAFSGINSGYGSGGMSGGGNMHRVLSAVKSPFTPSQWMELEHQALIYKYITANIPIPPHLLFPIRKAFESVAFSTFGLGSNSSGWGGFRLGFANNSDPEPGRCRRTDGKKWRCSRDAVSEYKYCERHMNRGRQRSRKPVEGALSGSHASAASTAKPLSDAVAFGGRASNGLSFSNLLNHVQPPATNPSASSHLERSFSEKEYEGGSKHEKESQYPLRQFINEWPKNHSDRPSLSWPEIDPLHSQEIEATQMRLGVGNIRNEENERETNWIPISWESSTGGPLGEVFHGTNIESKDSSPVNPMTSGWNSNRILGATLLNPSLPAL